MTQKKPKYVLVEEYIQQAIKTKQIVDKLPSERTLTRTLGFSYMTIRKAIDNLANKEVIYKVPTKGSFVNKQPQNKQTKTIGYFLDSSIVAGIASPYYALILDAIEKEAAKQNYNVVYFSDATSSNLHTTLSRLDGVIATCLPRTEHIILDIKAKLPVVVIDNAASDKSIPSVIIDNFNADIKSVDYIRSLGHRHIGFMTGLDDSDVGKNRYNGYVYGLNKNNIAHDDALVYRGNYSYQSGRDGAKYFMLLETIPSAVICANDSMALGAIKEFTRSGLRIPKDVSIVGFDDIEVASQVTPALTTVKAPIKEIAHHAVNMLLYLISGKDLEYRHIALDTKLIARQSCTMANNK